MLTPFGKLGPLTRLVIRRLLISDQVAASKFGTDSPLDHPVRERQELDRVREQAGSLDLPADATAAFFRDQISASKLVQAGLFDRWTARPDTAPPARPDLGAIRQELDRLTSELLLELKATEPLRATAAARTVRLELARRSGAALFRLDALHRRALGEATKSVRHPPA
jgi:chorismate mutase-like protein